MNKLKVGKEDRESGGEEHRDGWLPLISDYIDGTLPKFDVVRLEAHLAECVQCASDLEGLQQAANILQRLPDLPAPRSFTLTPAQARRLKPTPIFRFAQVAAAIAAAFLLFAFALDLAGVFATPTVAPNVAVVTTPEPTPTSEPVGSLNGAVTRASAGSISGLTVNVTPTAKAAPDPTATPVTNVQTSVPATNDFSAIRWIEIGLLIVAVLFATFAFAVRPRAPGRLKA